jgi:hypothetical protein
MFRKRQKEGLYVITTLVDYGNRVCFDEGYNLLQRPTLATAELQQTHAIQIASSSNVSVSVVYDTAWGYKFYNHINIINVISTYYTAIL